MKNSLFIFAILLSITFQSCTNSGTDASEDEISNFNVSVSVSPTGSGSISPSAGGTYKEGKEIELYARPNDEYLFSHWSGDIDSTSDNPLSLTVDQEYNLMANFELKTYELSINIEGEGTVNEEVIQQKSTDYEHGTLVELTAIPAEGYKFIGWQGSLTGKENPVQITINEPKEVTAVFEKKIFDLTVNTQGEGTVSEKIIRQKSTDYGYGTVVELTAIPDEGWKLFEWTGDISGSKNPIEITVDEAKEITAVFKKTFYLAENGVTIKCPYADVGESGVINGIIYTKRSATQIRSNNAESSCTSGIKDMTLMFVNTSLSADISSWDVSNVKSMDRMFMGASSFNGDLSNWDVSSVRNMQAMFYRASSFNGDISSWDVSRVTNMKSIFTEAKSFNGNINEWDISSINNMYGMFMDAISFNQNLNNWDVSNVTNMNSMFFGAKSFNRDISNWNVSNVTNMKTMFAKATSFNNDLNSWDVSNVTSMMSMFRGASSFNGDISNWDVSNVTDMSAMFSSATSFNGHISRWVVSSVNDMSSMFVAATSFNQNLNNWDVSHVTNMSYMFQGADSFNGDISNWNISNVKDMSWMFYSNSSFDQDIGNWDVSNVTNMDYLFWNASSFNQNISSWCVLKISFEPAAFSKGSPLMDKYKPVWGTCPN